MKRILCIIAVTMIATIAAFANIAPATKPVKAIDTTLSIKLDSNAKEARLVIPKSQIKQLRAELELLDDGTDNLAGTATGNDFSRTQTIVSGMFLSLAFVFGGAWFSRSGRLSTKGGKIAGAGMLVFAGSALATIVYGNAGPPPEARQITGKMFTQAVHMYGFGSGKIKLEASDEFRYATLVVPNPQKEIKLPGEE